MVKVWNSLHLQRERLERTQYLSSQTWVFHWKVQFSVVDRQSTESPNVRDQNMQICHSLRCKQIDMSMADWLILALRNDAGTHLSTIRSNAATLEKNSRLRVFISSYATNEHNSTKSLMWWVTEDKVLVGRIMSKKNYPTLGFIISKCLTLGKQN